LTILIMGNLLVSQGYADDVSIQPLTRLDCTKAELAWDENANVCSASSAVSRQPLTRLDCENAGMSWNDNANVCGAASQAAEALPTSGVAEPVPKAEKADAVFQPLTRSECDQAGMPWNDNANVCGAASRAAEALPEVQGAQPMPKSEVADTLIQPLTRSECDQAGMAWDDNANVCGAASQAAEALPESDVAEPLPKAEKANALSQPLTRSECDKAGMTWNDTTNVCGQTSEESATQTALQETAPVASTVLINVDKATQKMTVLLDGVQQYEWPVSTGLRGYTTPSGTYTTSSMNKIWYSRQWDNAPMFHAIFFTKRGHAIHGTLDEKNLGKAASHGCVRLSRANAETLFTLVKQNGLENSQVVLSGSTLGGEDKVASPGRSKSQYRRAARSYESYAKPRRRGGLFRRLLGRR
jgi:lipoprotein-anchoring transpeptidase ErfK/SrfK